MLLSYRGNGLSYSGVKKIKVMVKLYSNSQDDMWLKAVTKAPTPTEKSKKQRDNTKPSPKILITTNTDRLRTSQFWVTAATKLVRLNGFYGRQPSHSPQQQWYQTDIVRQKYCLQYKHTFIRWIYLQNQLKRNDIWPCHSNSTLLVIKYSNRMEWSHVWWSFKYIRLVH